MNPIDIILSVLVAVVCGTLGELTYSRAGWIINVSIAFLGALAGMAVARSFNAPTIYNITAQGSEFPIIYSLIGSVLFVAAIGFFIRPRPS